MISGHLTKNYGRFASLCYVRPTAGGSGAEGQQKIRPLTPKGQEAARSFKVVVRGSTLVCHSRRLVTGPDRRASASLSLPGALSPVSPQGGFQSVAAPLCPVLTGYSSRSTRDSIFRYFTMPPPALSRVRFLCYPEKNVLHFERRHHHAGLFLL